MIVKCFIIFSVLMATFSVWKVILRIIKNNIMDKKEIIKLLEEYAVQEHSNTLNRVIEMQDFDDLADELVKLFSIHIVSKTK